MLISSLHPTSPWRGASCPRPGQTFFREPPNRLVRWTSYASGTAYADTERFARGVPLRGSSGAGATTPRDTDTGCHGQGKHHHQISLPPIGRTTAPARFTQQGPKPDSTTGRRARQADVRSREGPFVSDTTDLMGARVEETAAAPATDASAPATGAGSRRRRGTGLEGMVLAELQQVASGLGIRGTARMRKSQLIEVIKEAQAAGGAPPRPRTALPRPSRSAAPPPAPGQATRPRREGGEGPRNDKADKAEKKADKAAEAPAENAGAQQQIEIPGQPASNDAPRSAAVAARPPRPARPRRSPPRPRASRRRTPPPSSRARPSSRAAGPGRRPVRRRRGRRGPPP